MRASDIGGVQARRPPGQRTDLPRGGPARGPTGVRACPPQAGRVADTDTVTTDRLPVGALSADVTRRATTSATVPGPASGSASRSGPGLPLARQPPRATAPLSLKCHVGSKRAWKLCPTSPGDCVVAYTRVTDEALRMTLLPPPFEVVRDSSVAPGGTLMTSSFESRSMTCWSAASMF